MFSKCLGLSDINLGKFSVVIISNNSSASFFLLLLVFPRMRVLHLSPGGSSGKKRACRCRRHKRHGFDPCVGKIPWRRAWQPTLVLLPEEFHGQRSLAGYRVSKCHRELDVTELSQHARPTPFVVVPPSLDIGFLHLCFLFFSF